MPPLSVVTGEATWLAEGVEVGVRANWTEWMAVHGAEERGRWRAWGLQGCDLGFVRSLDSSPFSVTVDPFMHPPAFSL